VPSNARVAAGAFGFLIFSHAFDGPDLYGASSLSIISPKDSCAVGGIRLRPRRSVSVPSRNRVSAKDSDPTLRGHPRTPSPSLRQKSAFAQPINYNRRRVAIPEERKSLKTRRSPKCRSRSTRERSDCNNFVPISCSGNSVALTNTVWRQILTYAFIERRLG
jgi:hypothetical protein